MNDNVQIFAFAKQQKFLRSRAKRKTALCGRGFGKTNLIGKVVSILFNYMPRARFALVGQTYISLDLVTISEIRDSLEMCGIHEYSAQFPYGHYVIGKQPPAHWPQPYKKVGALGYQYCMTHISGCTLQFISQDRKETSRGLNLDGAIVDERGSIQTDFLRKIIYPTIRPNAHSNFKYSQFAQIKYEFGSAPWTADGQSMFKVEEEYLAEQVLRQRMSEADLKNIPPEYLWLEGTCLDNPITGQKYYDDMRKDLDAIEFDVEVCNMRLTQLPNGYYHQFVTTKHCYLPQNCYDYDDKTGHHQYKPNDYRNDIELNITLDFNADICWSLVLQKVGNTERLINSKYIKPSIGQDLSILIQGAKWFCDEYENHPDKVVYLYGDPGGNSRSANTSNQNKPFFDEYHDYLTSRGWTVFRRELISYPLHIEKYRLVNYLFAEENQNLPKIRFNQYAGSNKAVIISIQCTPVKQGNDLFEKDKTSERRGSTNREFATDSTDALDYYLWAKYRKLLPGKTYMKNSIIVI